MALHFLSYVGAVVTVHFAQQRLAGPPSTSAPGRLQHKVEVNTAAAEEKHRVKRKIEFVMLGVVLTAVTLDTCVVSHLAHEHRAAAARRAIQSTNTLTTNLLAEQENRPTSSFVIRDQAITKIVSQIYWLILDEFPEIGLKAVSLHMIPSNRHHNEVWNVVQVGRERKPRDLLPLYQVGSKDPGSLVAASMIKKQIRYCADVQKNCPYYLHPGSAAIEYMSLACFPLSSTVDDATPAFAAICLDGEGNHPWKDRLGALAEELNDQASTLIALLHEYRKDDSCIFQPQGDLKAACADAGSTPQSVRPAKESPGR